MAHVFDDVRENFAEFITNNTDKGIEDWIAINKGLPSYKMPSKATLKNWFKRVIERRMNL